MATGEDILNLARRHIEEKYVYGAHAPKDNANWKGPWDCAELVSWCVYQVSGKLYGCYNNDGKPSKADANTGYWKRDAKSIGIKISVQEAAAIPGAAVLRSGRDGHIVISDGNGGTVEAKGKAYGVVTDKISGRNWTMGILVPGINYTAGGSISIHEPSTIIYRVTDPYMTGDKVKEIQNKLKEQGIDPGVIDGIYGSMTEAAVIAFQVEKGIVADGEVGEETAKKLGINL
ncbi:peptidoglycan-binding domain-containing protein [Candidatus Magnetoovum chiemensis]|nr:peptidoglycan-binding domain-containing protein [Candidatus Magnetoovum chiemensis]